MSTIFKGKAYDDDDDYDLDDDELEDDDLCDDDDDLDDDELEDDDLCDDDEDDLGRCQTQWPGRRFLSTQRGCWG